MAQHILDDNPHTVLDRMYAKSNGRRRIRITHETTSAYTLAPIPEVEAARTGFTYAHVTVNKEDIEQRTDLSDDPIKQLVPVHKHYIPESGGSAFIPGSALPAPPCIAQSAIETGGQVTALIRAAQRDTEPFRQLFNKMWGLPEEFDVGVYAPLIQPERTKPWLRYGKDSNYEVRYMKDAQAMLHVSNGDYTNTFKERKLEIDWDAVRNHMRALATNIFFTEPGVFQNLLQLPDKFRLYFKLNAEMFPTVHEPTFSYKPGKFKPVNVLPQEEIQRIITYVPPKDKYAFAPMIKLLKVLPPAVMDEIRNQGESLIVKASVPKVLINYGVPDLMSSEYSNTTTVTIKTKGKMHNKLTLTQLMVAAIKSWILQVGYKVPDTHTLAMLLFSEEYGPAYEMLRNLLPDTLLTCAFRYYTESGVHIYEKGALKELLAIIYGDDRNYPYFSTISVHSMLSGAMRKHNPTFFKIYKEAYNEAMNSGQKLSVFDMLNVNRLNTAIEDPVIVIKQAAYERITRFYCMRYRGKMKAIKMKLDASQTPPKDLVERLRILQARISFYPYMGFTEDVRVLNKRLTSAAEHYIRKRSRLYEYLGAITELPDTNPVLGNASIIDQMLNSDFLAALNDSRNKAEETRYDVEQLGFDEYPEKVVRFDGIGVKFIPTSKIIEQTYSLSAKDFSVYVQDQLDMLEYEVYPEPADIIDEPEDYVNDYDITFTPWRPPSPQPDAEDGEIDFLALLTGTPDEDDSYVDLKFISLDEWMQHSVMDFYPEAILRVLRHYHPEWADAKAANVDALNEFLTQHYDEIEAVNKDVKQEYLQQKVPNGDEALDDQDVI